MEGGRERNSVSLSAWPHGIVVRCRARGGRNAAGVGRKERDDAKTRYSRNSILRIFPSAGENA